ncbi:hypothetical protein [Streptomyces prasinopilosus]|uniref:Uncharacterized protein n=1 Tax=Streptomyces prasinopilosus TaxID=67344 RepID=A0A1G6QWB6_9ACTN|nr:hypothetical protein [Streptomyces prasinopilosus]SDC96729.1 hypothetical protein SAMN05216505_104285 [Streptomyces prasinopilosus]
MNERVRAHGADRSPGGDGAGRRSAGRTRFVGVLLITLSLVSAVLCCVAFAVWLPSDRERYRDYRAAEPCSARATGQAESDCLRTWRFTIVKTVVENGGKSSSYEATLKDGDSWRGDVAFGDPGPLLERLEPGDEVTATVWRRDIVALGKDGVWQNSSEAPRDELQMNAALGMLAGFVAAEAFVFGAVRLVRPRDRGPFTWNPYGKWLLLTGIAVCFGVGLPAVWTGTPWWVVPAVGVPVAACAAGVMHHSLRLRTAGGA